MIEVTPISGSIGAEISGIDLREPITDELFKSIEQALVDNLVIFFRDQDIEPANHVALASRFGEPHTHPAYPNPDGFPQIVKLIRS